MTEGFDMELYRCPECGRYASPDDGYSDRIDRGDDCSEIEVFCSVVCSSKFHGGAK